MLLYTSLGGSAEMLLGFNEHNESEVGGLQLITEETGLPS